MEAVNLPTAGRIALEIIRIEPEEIIVRDRFRASLNDDAVSRLADSMHRIGLQVAISIILEGEDAVLVAGRHRLAAAIRLGWPVIECRVHSDAVGARLWEISENLHRSDLSVQERADHIAEWLKLTEIRQKENPEAHNAPLEIGYKKPPAQQSGGINAAVRELGIDRTEAQRAVKISSIPDDVRRAADDAGLNSQKARLEIAKAEDGAAKVRELAEARVKPAPAIKNAFESEEDWRRALFNVWNRGAQDWRHRAFKTMDAPVFDRTRAGAHQ